MRKNPYPIDKIATGPRLQGPSAQHWFGTDNLGRDLFSRIVFGAQITLQIGAIALTIAAFAGTLIGIVSGFYGGWIDFL
jgi:peptide/nickel transport system permease protein